VCVCERERERKRERDFFLGFSSPSFGICKNLSFYFSLYFDGSSPNKRSLGNYVVGGEGGGGEILLYLLISHGKSF
jgi:hypothetical protein